MVSQFPYNSIHCENDGGEVFELHYNEETLFPLRSQQDGLLGQI